MNSNALPQPGLARSILAIMVGLLINFVGGLGLDQLFHGLDVYPPWGEPMNDTSDNLLALSYRIVIAIGSCYVAGRLAAWAPMRHALILGMIGVVFGALGAMATANMDLGPMWFPATLIILTLPSAWVGGRLARSAIANNLRSQSE
jgi:hypothetical protein